MNQFGLRGKFIALIVLILGSLFALIAYFMLQTNIKSLRQDLVDRSKAFATLATVPIGNTFLLYNQSGSELVRQQTGRYTELDTSIANVMVVNLQGKVLFSQHDGPKAIPATQANSFDPVYISNSAGLPTRIVFPFIEDSGRHSYALVYDVSTAAIDEAVKHAVRQIILFALFGLLISALTTYFFINKFFLKPIANVSRLAGIIAAGDFEQQITSKRHDEIGALADSVNHMAENLKSDIQKLKEVDRLKNEFIMITSHNLRTPLTIIKGNVELLQGTKLSTDTQKMIHAIETSALSLSIFSEDMLTIASIEAGNTELAKREEAIAAALGSLEGELENQAALKRIKIKWKISHPDRKVTVSARHLRDVIRNLTSNAIKFSPEGSIVSITLDRAADHLAITVSDKGIGISRDEIPKLFTKFHRGTSTLQYDYQGTGIGLYASKLIVEAHGGTIGVETIEGKGSTFTVRIPQPLITA